MDLKLKPNSLASRYFFAAAVVLPILLGFSAYSLDKAFKKSLINAEKDALKAQIYLLLGSAEPNETSLALPTDFAEPRFSAAESGLYASVVSENNIQAWRSTSYTLTEALAKNNAKHSILPKINKSFDDSTSALTDQAGIFYFNEVFWLNKKMFQLSYKTIWEFGSGEQAFNFVIIHSQESFQQELKLYRNTMWIWMGGMSILLLFSQLFIVRWSLVPLKHLAKDINQLDMGETNQLTGEYPNEIRPVTQNLNRVLAVEQQQRNKYKNTLSDLAHSLKTPLAIVQGAIDANTNAESSSKTISEQIKRMTDIISHQLKRATFSSHALVKDKINIHQLFTRLNGALQKVYRDKNVQFQNNIDSDTLIVGEEDDFMEVFGNMMENAFKYGCGMVQVNLTHTQSFYELSIEDNGTGIPADLKHEILKRGARADTATSGQGIGLAVAVEIISSYNGALRTEVSTLGGAKFIISLPKRQNQRLNHGR